MAKCFIIIGSINKKLILLLIACITQITYSIINTFVRQEIRFRFYSAILNRLVMSISQMLVRLYPLILKITNEQKPNIRITKKRKFLHYCFLCFILILMIIIGFISEFIARTNINNSNNLFPSNNPIVVCFEMIFLILISKYFLEYKYFKHHIISLIVLILIGLLFFFCYDIRSSFTKFIILIILRIAHAALDAVYRCYQKYMMEKLYYPYWNIAFVPGLILFPITLVLFIIQLKFYNDQNLEDYLTNFIIFKIVLPLIFNVIMTPLTILIVYYFPPDYILIITLLESIFRTIKVCIKREVFNALFILLHIIQILAMLIYLEIFELNFCGLNKNTRRNIDLRGEIDQSVDDGETISEDNNTDTGIDSSLEVDEKINEDYKTEEEEEEKDDEKLINS